MRRSSGTRPLTAFSALLLVGLLLSACSSIGPAGSADSGSATTAPPAATTSASQESAPSPSTATTTGAPGPTADLSAEPPAATLSVEGGDPVAGQLGSFTWNGGGSDSPWLPGAPLSIGAGERLTALLAGGVAVDTWSARSAPAGSSDGADALEPGRRIPRWRPPDRLRPAGERPLVRPAHGPLRRRAWVSHLLLAGQRAMTDRVGVAHFARRCQPRSGPAACRSACAVPSARRSRSSAWP